MVKLSSIFLLKDIIKWLAYAASQNTVLHMKRLNQTESPIFVFFVSKGNPFRFLLYHISTIVNCFMKFNEGILTSITKLPIYLRYVIKKESLKAYS